MTRANSQSMRRSRPASTAFALLAAVLLAACATANIGGVRHSDEVTRAFETYFVNPDYRYYFYNQENNPYAVVGLQNDYFIESPDWRQLDPTSEKFQKVIDLVKAFPEGFSQPYGSYLLDPEGERIGMWYSSLAPPGVRVDPESKRVSINAPRPWLRDEDTWWPGAGVGIGIGSGGSGVGIRMGW